MNASNETITLSAAIEAVEAVPAVTEEIITLTMTRQQATDLRRLTSFNVTVPESFAQFGAPAQRACYVLLQSIARALDVGAGRLQNRCFENMGDPITTPNN